ncbi:hypothetical protein EJ05DRAFT_479334 [Pseudovirgaria hyperparasitica]|uniref:PEBP-like protein n=1 Tax=Pseudovirgaria hyperparasitica TaxID=470096 RepID=A0A6A6VYJ6_9PEZI|nr:uncharacterized protein EJ05DRAFT_479334 [Pseudovirgaria hyperparasitica]KAF2754929.1 hypothetical protein EJ05DRAFT_479334 [Pseudovirgaria hyperparasitica]
MVDPDAPDMELPLFLHFLHYKIYDLQPDCPGPDPEVQASYMLLTPLSVSQHRYILLVYRQPPNYTPTPIDPVTLVAHAPFNLQQYAADNKLELVGGNFMQEGLSNVLSAP